MTSLVEIDQETFGVDVALAYATSDNLAGRPVYARAAAFLHPDAARCLSRACELAAALGYRVRIYDAFRPREAHDQLWAVRPDPEFVADPARGSDHSRGVAIDLTLIDQDGRPLDMGTAFDAFEQSSYHGSTDISQQAQRNRFTLLGIMTAAGWRHNPNEWWHYQLPDARSYPLLSDVEAKTGLA